MNTNAAYQLINMEGKLNQMRDRIDRLEIRLHLLELQATKGIELNTPDDGS